MKFLKKKPSDMNGKEAVAYTLLIGTAITAGTVAACAVTYGVIYGISSICVKRKEKKVKEEEEDYCCK